MRSAEPLHALRGRRAAPLRALALAGLLALGGCGTLDKLRATGASATPATSAADAAPVANAPASDAAASARPAATAPRPASTGPLAPATQRAYDDALAQLRAGHAPEAERALRALAQSMPDLAGPHANLGLIARQAGRVPEAVAELETATRLAPQQPVMWNQLGIAYRQQGRFPQARAAYEHALALDANYATAVLNLGVLEDLYLGDSAQALELYTRYLALTPAGDASVTKWIADLKNRKPAAAPGAASAPVASTAPKEKS